MSRVFSFFKRGADTRADQPARVLVVDDEHNIRMTVQLALEQAGLAVDTAADGPEGLKKFGDGSGWDLVLLDQRMPGMEGLEVLREMRRRDPQARAIMITAFGTIDLAVDAMKAGATDFLRKPFTTDMLRNAAQAALQRAPTAPRPPEAQAVTPASAAAVTFGITTINGFRIESEPAAVTWEAGALFCSFTMRSPDGEGRIYGVRLPAYVVELVKAHAGRDEIPGGDRFWQALCEEALANSLWQCGGFPDDATLELDDLTTGLRRWIEAVLAAAAEPAEPGAVGPSGGA